MTRRLSEAARALTATATPGQGLRGPATARVRRVQLEVSPTTLLVLVVVGAALWLVVRLAPVLLVLAVALLIVGTLSPVVRGLEAQRIRRGLGIAVVFTTVFITTVLLTTLTVPSLEAEAVALIEGEPAFRATLADQLQRSRVSAPLAEWLRRASYDGQLRAAGPSAFASTLHVFEIAAYGMSAIFLALYMMIDRDRLRGGLFSLVPRTHHIRLSRVMLHLENIVGAYIRGQMLTSLFMAAFTFVVLTACGVENALALAVFAGMADVLPYIGVFLSVVPAVIAAFGRGPAEALTVLVLMLAYEEFESRVLVPRVYGQALRLSSSVVLFSLLAGSTLLGFLGALLALPVAATVVMLIEELRVELPGEPQQVTTTALRAQDDLEEQEYERRSEGVAAEQAAAIAVEISGDRKVEPPLAPAPEAPVTPV